MNKDVQHAWMAVSGSLFLSPVHLIISYRTGGFAKSPMVRDRLAPRLGTALFWTVCSAFLVPLAVIFFAVVLQQYGLALLVVLLLTIPAPLGIHLVFHFSAMFDLLFSGARHQTRVRMATPRWFATAWFRMLSG